MLLVRESRLLLPFRFRRRPGPLADMVLPGGHSPGAPEELREIRLRAPFTGDPALDDYLISLPAAAAPLSVDHLELALAFEVPRLPDFAAPDDLALRLEDASCRLTSSLLGRFLFHLKFRTGTIWHAHSPIGGRNVWTTAQGDEFAARPTHPPLAPGQELTAEIWAQLTDDLCGGREPPAHDLAFHQARELLAFGMRAVAVLSAAVACETKARRTVEALQARKPGGLADPEYVRLTGRHAKIPASHVLSTVLDRVCGRNLARERRPLFEATERLFNIRNTVAHTGSCALREGEQEREVDCGEVAALLDAVSEVHAWLEELSALNLRLEPHARLNTT